MPIDSNKLICEFSSKLKKEHLHLRLFRQSGGLIFERELIEEDGSSRSQALPIISLENLRAFMMADPYYEALKSPFELLFDRIKKEL